MGTKRTPQRDSDSKVELVREIKRRHEHVLLAKANVVGVGVGTRVSKGRRTGEVALVVLVTHKVPLAQLDPEDVIPQEIEGVRVDVHEAGELKPHG